MNTYMRACEHNSYLLQILSITSLKFMLWWCLWYGYRKGLTTLESTSGTNCLIRDPLANYDLISPYMPGTDTLLTNQLRDQLLTIIYHFVICEGVDVAIR